MAEEEKNLNEKEIVETPVVEEETEELNSIVEEENSEETTNDDYNAVETDPEEFFSEITTNENTEIPTVETVDEDSVNNDDENTTTEEDESGSTYPMDFSNWYLPEDDYVETDPDLMVKDWDDSKYKTNPNAVRTNGPRKAAAASITYRKLSGNNSIAASGVTIDPESGKTLDAYIKGNALWINGTKVIWYEE